MSALSLSFTDSSWIEAGTPIVYTMNNGVKNEVYLQAAVSIQPVVVSWNMGQNFNGFSGGLYNLAAQNDAVNGCVNDPAYTDHQMLVVGYDTTLPNKLWIVQNRCGSCLQLLNVLSGILLQLRSCISCL